MWIINTEYGGIMDTPVVLKIIDYRNRTIPLYKLLEEYPELIFVMTGYYSGLDEDIPLVSSMNKEMLIFVLDFNTGSACDSVVLYYGLSIYQSIFPLFNFISFETTSLLFIGKEEELTEVISDTLKILCKLYDLSCKIMLCDEITDLYLKNISNEIENNKYILSGFNYINSEIIIPKLLEYIELKSLKINIIHLIITRSTLDFIDLDNPHITHYAIEPIPTTQEEHLINQYYIPINSNNITISPAFISSWRVLYYFKIASEYVQSLNISELYTKLHSTLNLESQKKTDNIYPSTVRIVKYDINEHNFVESYSIHYPVPNMLPINYKYYYVPDYYICAINYYKSGSLLKRPVIYAFAISYFIPYRVDGLSYRISQILGTLDINTNAKLSSGSNYLRLLDINVYQAGNAIEKIKEDIEYYRRMNLTIKHCFGSYYNDMFMHNCDNDPLLYNYDILWWIPSFLTGYECPKANIVSTGISGRQFIQYPLSYLFAVQTDDISIIYRDLEEIEEYYNLAISYITLYHGKLHTVVKLPDEYSDNDLNNGFYKIISEMPNGGIILSLLFNYNTTDLYTLLNTHFHNNKGYILYSPGVLPLYRNDLIVGHYDIMEYIRILNNDNSTLFSSAIESMKFNYTCQLYILYDTYLSFKIFEYYLSSSNVNNIEYIQSDLPNIRLRNFYMRDYAVNNDNMIERTISLVGFNPYTY